MSTLSAHPMSQPAPPPNFNLLAGPYRWLEYFSFGPWLARARSAFLPQLAPCRNALVLGDGDGRFTASLLRANPMVRVHAIDASAAMLRALIRCDGPDGVRVYPELADARHWQPAQEAPQFDAIFTHFFLDCLATAEIQSMAEALRPSLSPSALWVVSEFAIPPGRFGRFVARPLIWSLYRVFGVLTGLTVRILPDHDFALRAAGFALQERQTRLAGLLVSELWSPVSDA